MTSTIRKPKTTSKIILGFCVFVVHQGWPPLILSMISIDWPYTLETSTDIRGDINKTSPSKEDDKKA